MTNEEKADCDYDYQRKLRRANEDCSPDELDESDELGDEYTYDVYLAPRSRAMVLP